MKLDADRTLLPETPAVDVPHGQGWGAVVVAVAAMLLVLVGLYYPTAASMVAIWRRSETFAHGFLVVPAVLWLVWRARAQVAALAPRPQYAAVLAVAGLGFGWLLAELGGVLVVQQLAVTAMIPAAIVAVLGWRIAWALAFPLAFLLFAVPIGEGLINPLMNFTADFTVAMLQLVGIPVYREGTFFSIPSGNWSVVEGCSGLRYLIASVTAGCLYAYLNYERSWKRLAFIAASVAVPIVANGLRAFMIVMIAHLSDMQLALGVDHFIYGWVFFGLVMILLFWAGSRWHDPVPARSPTRAHAPRSAELQRVLPAAMAVLAVAAIWPAYAHFLDRIEVRPPPTRLVAPAGANGWQRDAAPLTDWRPRYRGADPSFFEVYRKGDLRIALYLGYYRRQRQGAELVNSQNVMVPQEHPVWEDVGASFRTDPVSAKETMLRSTAQRLLVWDWMQLAGTRTTNPYYAKALLAKNRLLGRPDDGVAVIVAAPYEEDRTVAADALREFVRDMLPAIDAAVRTAADS